MSPLIAVLPGDGIGREVIREALRVLAAVADVRTEDGVIGGAAIDAVGTALPDETLALCQRADAVLLGAVGGPQWDDAVAGQGLLQLRQRLGLFANLRPVVALRGVAHASPLRPELCEDVDILIVRELTGGIYFGERRRDAERAFDTCTYTTAEIERIVRVAAPLAAGRRGRLTSVDKANVLATSALWRETTERVMREEFPEVATEHLLVDAAAMHLLRRPASFDVVLTPNLFGDILSDEASLLAGSLGMLPSASLGEGRVGLYEPVHGSAPDIAGRGIANPCGAIASVAMMLRHSLGLEAEARAVESAVAEVCLAGVLTADVAREGGESAATAEVGDAVVAALG